MKHYILQDDEFFSYRIEANSFRGAIKFMRDHLSMQKGRLKLITFCGNYKKYRLINSDYVFTLYEIL